MDVNFTARLSRKKMNFITASFDKIFCRMQGLSCVSPNYMTQQFDINEKMRAILIDWLIEVRLTTNFPKRVIGVIFQH